MSTRGKAVVAGASGFIGRAIVGALEADGYDAVRVGRREDVRWNDADALAAAVDGAAIVVNLAGKSVNCRYTDRNRDEILRSRVETTRMLRTAVAAASTAPAAWLNASTATIYRHETERPNTETNGRLGSGFSVDVARAWETEFFAGELPGTRRVALRMAIVLGDGPATRMLTALARTGLGGPQIDGWCPPHRRYRGIGDQPSGSDRAPWYRTHGRQRFSWVHIDDVVGAVRFLRDSADLDGVVNVASPNPTDNRGLMRELRGIVGAPIGMPSWRWMLEPAMWVLRTEPELILKSRWVVPGRLTEAGYVFERPDLADALAATAGRVRR
jgi:NAD dependent epimerase/dehydratase family enzyme